MFLLFAAYTECNRVVFIAMLLLTAAFGGNYWAGIRVNPLDLAPNYAGPLLSLVNGIGSIVTFIFPILVGLIISDVRITKIQWLKQSKLNLYYWIEIFF